MIEQVLRIISVPIRASSGISKKLIQLVIHKLYLRPTGWETQPLRFYINWSSIIIWYIGALNLSRKIECKGTGEDQKSASETVLL